MSTTILGIDIGSSEICAIIAQKNDEHIKVIGAGISRSSGIKKGIITNIDLASKSIRNALNDAKMVAGTHFESVVVSISGAYTKSVESTGIVNIPNKEIGIKEIKRAMELAHYNADIPTDYEKLHVLPYNFKIDDQNFIDDPLGMNGSRMEVQAHIITVQKSSLSNLTKAVKSAGIDIANIVLNGYASAIATLNYDERELGAAVVDIGGATCNLVVHSGNSIRFNDFLGVGSINVTSDLSMALHTPINAAEEVKLSYGSLERSSKDILELPDIGDEGNSHEVSLDIVSNVIYARVEETLMILSKSIENSGFKNNIGAGIVLTGGMTKIEGIRELAAAIFDNMPVRIAKPKEIEGLFDTLRDPKYSAAIGLILYGAGDFTPYEIDSNMKMRYKNETITAVKSEETIQEEAEVEKMNELQQSDGLSKIAHVEPKESLGSKVSKFWNSITQLF